ncbi:MAG: homoserine dehydrogenase [Candidatus Omnitrophica bacterium]|nr:homoserine dehydrogenase [Candidatus Omnitrophota bacterium]MCM8793495.1 homoserine dehydrogenase [Candidatus Omnitrophota bacterium]
MRTINVGLIGLGTVGQGVAETLLEKKNYLIKRLGFEIKLKMVCDIDLRKAKRFSFPSSMVTRNAFDILNDQEIEIVVELIGGIHPAKEYILTALKNNKYVVTANKALLAEEGKEIFSLVQKKGLGLGFEASVGGGIPIIKAIRESLIGNRIVSILGILNGTSNFILTEMYEKGCDFRYALKIAQEKGYAEKNPYLDIEGIDSAHKLLILTFLGFGYRTEIKRIYVEGISGISHYDILYAKELGYVIKLLAVAKLEGYRLEIRVNPTLLPERHLLASVRGIHNAVYINGDMVGEAIFYGEGAGQMPAASSVVSDIVDLSRMIIAGSNYTLPNLLYNRRIKGLLPIKDVESRYYMRFMAIDKPGVLAKISGILGRKKISIASVSQKERRRAKVVPVVLITHEAKERDLRSALEMIEKLDVVKDKPVAIRIEELTI